MSNKTVIQAIAEQIERMFYCEDRLDDEKTTVADAARLFDNAQDAKERLAELTARYLPSGSGIDSGSKLALDRCSENRIVIETAFHHMNQHGYYDGWTSHSIVLTPAFTGFNLRVTGRNRNGIKEYLADLFRHALSEPVK